MKAMKKSKVFTKLLRRITKEKCEDVATEYMTNYDRGLQPRLRVQVRFLLPLDPYSFLFNLRKIRYFSSANDYPTKSLCI